MNKKIITIAEIVFALIFVVILAVIMGTITNKGNSANTKLVDTLEMTDSSSLNSYADNSIVKGESVKSAISQIKSIGGDLKLNVYVETKANSGSYKTYSDTNKYTVSDTTANDYINPSASFKCWQIINNNNVVTGLYFAQDGSSGFSTKPSIR